MGISLTDYIMVNGNGGNTMTLSACKKKVNPFSVSYISNLIYNMIRTGFRYKPNNENGEKDPSRVRYLCNHPLDNDHFFFSGDVSVDDESGRKREVSSLINAARNKDFEINVIEDGKYALDPETIKKIEEI